MTQAKTDWLPAFPDLDALDAESRRLLAEGSRQVTLPAGTPLFRSGDLCENFMLVVDGQVRVQKVAATGREIVLYRVESGQSCILTTACLVNAERYTAEGLTETDIDAVVIPRSLFHTLLGRSEGFRRFVFGAYATRLADLLCLIEEVAFGRIDMRLAAFLLDHAGADGTLKVTHQELAIELGTAREVVSRQLKDFERRGWVALGRGQIALTGPNALRMLATKQAV